MHQQCPHTPNKWTRPISYRMACCCLTVILYLHYPPGVRRVVPPVRVAKNHRISSSRRVLLDCSCQKYCKACGPSVLFKQRARIACPKKDPDGVYHIYHNSLLSVRDDGRYRLAHCRAPTVVEPCVRACVPACVRASMFVY